MSGVYIQGLLLASDAFLRIELDGETMERADYEKVHLTISFIRYNEQ